jgi:hypothetical protein
MEFTEERINDQMSQELLGLVPRTLQARLAAAIELDFERTGDSPLLSILDRMLDRMASAGDLDALKWLEGAGASLVAKADALAQLAAAGGWPMLVRDLFGRRPEVWIDEYKVICVASIAGRTQVVDELLALGVNPDGGDHHALYDAVRLGHHEIVVRFLRLDAAMAPDVIDTALAIAARAGHFEVVLTLVRVCSNNTILAKVMEECLAAYQGNVDIQLRLRMVNVDCSRS